MDNFHSRFIRMKYFKERFGQEEIALTPAEENELKQNLIKSDLKRIGFFALVSLLISGIFIILDMSSLYDLYNKSYFILDCVLFLVSLFVLIYNYKSNIRFGRVNVETLIFYVYPITCIVWASGIATLNPDSVMNIITFYLVFFLLSFFLSLNTTVYTSYFITVIVVYLLVTIPFGRKIFSEQLVVLTIGAFITLPFYSTFKNSRRNSTAAVIRLNKSNKQLEQEVNEKIKQLRNVNEDLNNEIAQRKLMESKLRDALKKAETSDKLKSEFLANISHEIRTPLNAIIGFTEMMTEDGVDDETKKTFHKLIASNTMYLLSTIDDIFDASMVKTQQINLVKMPLLVNKFLNGVFYESSGIAIKYNSPDIEFIPLLLDEDVELITDEYYLKKALLRLIDNAYKFTKAGSISVGARYRKAELEFFVADTGIGIGEEYREKIFHPFVQGDGSFTRDYGGSGLGLSIVKGIVTEMNCSFEFESEKDKGTTFSILFNKIYLKKLSEE